MTDATTEPFLTRLTALIRGGGRTYSAAGQYATLVAMYPFITYFSLFDFVPQVAQPQVFDILTQAVNEPAATEAAVTRTHYQASAILIFFLSGYVPGLLHCLWRRAWGWLAIGMIAAHLTLLDLAADYGAIDFGPLRDLIADMPMIGVKISLLWIIFRGRILSRSFLLYGFTSALLTSVLAQASGYETLDALRQVLPLMIFAMTVALARLAIHATVQNSYFLKLLGWRRGMAVTAHTAVLWIPILVFAVPYFVITALVQSALEDAAYEQRAMLIHPYDETATIGCAYLDGGPAYLLDLMARSQKNEAEKAALSGPISAEQDREGRIADLREKGTDLRLNTMYSIYRFYDCKQKEWIAKTTTFENQVRGQPYDRLSDEFKRQYNDVLTARLPMQPPNYSGMLGGIKNWSVRQMQGQINGAYAFIRTSAREKLAEKIDEEIEPRIKDASGRIGNKVQVLRDEVTPMFQEANRATQISVWWVFSTFNALHMFAHILFSFLCVKSFLYVFGRVAFASNAGAFLTLGNPDAASDTHHGEVRITGQDYALGSDKNGTFGEAIEGTYYFSRRFQPHGMPPRFTIPQPAGAPIARLLHRSMTMNRFDFVPDTQTDRKQALYFTVTGSKTFVEWNLAEDETIVFDFTNFVGMAGTVKLSTLISARISTLQLGKYVFSTATGPGRVVLLTDGRPKTGNDPETEVSMPPERLVAWQQNMRFHVDSSLALPDIYLSTAYVRKAGPGTLVMDVDKQHGKGTGLSRFITHFLWPG